MPDMKKLLPFLILATALASAQASGPTHEKPATPPLTVEQILNKYIAAIGGDEKLLRVKTIVAKGTIQTPYELETFARYRKAPYLFATIEEHKKGAKTGRGYDGQTFWTLSPEDARGGKITFFGGRDLRDASILAEFHIHPYTAAELRGTQRVKDRTAYVVRLYQKDRRVGVYFFDVETFLLLRADTEPSAGFVVRDPEPMSLGSGTPLPSFDWITSTYYSDWREVDGLKVPFEITTKKTTTKILSYGINTEIDEKAFAPLPESLKFNTIKKPAEQSQPR